MSLHSILEIEKDCKCISVCGSGGKSSLCYALARESSLHGLRTAITTTTHIGIPNMVDTSVISSENMLELENVFSKNMIPVVGKQDGNKLSCIGKEQFDYLMSKADRLIVEADGSKMLPLKYPNETEPVLPEESNVVFTVCGLSSFGRPLQDVCHRYELIGNNIRGLSDTVDAFTIATILWEGYGKFAPIFILNQADTDFYIETGIEVQNYLYRYGAKKVFILSLRKLGFASQRFF